MTTRDDFHTDSRPLVADSITGVRSFRVDKLGRLTGVTHTKVWRPGLNTATCPHLPIKAKATAEDLDAATEAVRAFGQAQPDPYSSSMLRALTGFTIHATERKKVDKGHRPGGFGCECGYWAYFADPDEFSDEHTLTGIVSAQGVVTVGSKGFRAEKAEVVALVEPRREGQSDESSTIWQRWSDWIYEHQYGWQDTTLVTALTGVVLIAIALSIISLTGGAGIEASWTALALALSSLAGWLIRNRGVESGRKRHAQQALTIRFTPFDSTPREPVTPERWEAVRRNYPDVPTYPSLKAALRDFPLSEPPKPEPITPENTPDFWERSS